MTAVSTTYVAYDKLFLGLSVDTAQIVGVIVGLTSFVGFLSFTEKKEKATD